MRQRVERMRCVGRAEGQSGRGRDVIARGFRFSSSPGFTQSEPPRCFPRVVFPTVAVSRMEAITTLVPNHISQETL